MYTQRSFSTDECCWLRIAVFDVRKHTVYICCDIHTIMTTLAPQLIDTFPNVIVYDSPYYARFWNIFLPKEYIVDYVVNWNPILPLEKDDRFMFYHRHSNEYYDAMAIINPDHKLYSYIDPELRVTFAS